jgi:hypothetical protein
MVGALLVGVLCLPGGASAQQRPAIADQIAKAYGFDAFGQVEAIRYTFTLDGGPKFRFHRSWVWEPKTDTITYDGPDKDGKPVKVTYTRSQLASQSAFVKEMVDPSFFNDQYWLVLPFHLIWDTGATVEDAGMHKLPKGKGKARKVVLQYPSNGGYTPGDTWTIFVGHDMRIQELEFRHGGAAKPTLVKANWFAYKKVGPLLVSTDHHGTADGKPFRLFYTDVAVKLTGSSTWMEAK